jgi:hypothetical protein
MKKYILPFLLSVFILGCSDDNGKAKNDSAVVAGNDSVKNTVPDSMHVTAPMDSTKLLGSHLKDTVTVLGDWVIFLRPDSMRFESYSKSLKQGINEDDAYFGDAVSMSIDTIIGNKDFKGLKAMISNKRYIKVMDCKNGPVTIDRDTVNFGVILTGTAKDLKAEQNVYPGAHYLKLIRKYFGLKK